MNVIIKNFDMPTRCAECIVCIDKENNDYGYFGKCLLQNKKNVDCLMWSRDGGCPLAESGEQRMHIVCEKCKYNNYGQCEFYVMGSGNETDMPCYQEKN